MAMDNYRIVIVEYLEKNIRKGYTMDSLKWALIGQGYPRASIDRAIEEFNREMAKKAPILREDTKIKHVIEEIEEVPVKKSFWKTLFGR